MKKKLALTAVILFVAGTASAATTIDPNFLQMDDNNPLTFGQDNDFNLSYDSGNSQLLLEQSNGNDVFQANTGGVFQILNRDLNLDGGNLDNVGNVDGVDVDNHNTRHEDGGNDEINVGGLPGQLSDAQQVNIQDSGTSLGLFDTLNFNNNLEISDTGSGVLELNASGGGGGTAFNVSDDGSIIAENPTELSYNSNLQVTNNYNVLEKDGFEDGDYTSNPSWQDASSGSDCSGDEVSVTNTDGDVINGTYSLDLQPPGVLADCVTKATLNQQFDLSNGAKFAASAANPTDVGWNAEILHIGENQNPGTANSVQASYDYAGSSDVDIIFTSYNSSGGVVDSVEIPVNDYTNYVRTEVNLNPNGIAKVTAYENISGSLQELDTKKIQWQSFNQANYLTFETVIDQVTFDDVVYESERAETNIDVPSGDGSGLDADTVDGLQGSTLDNAFNSSYENISVVEGPNNLRYDDNLFVSSTLSSNQTEGWEDGDYTSNPAWSDTSDPGDYILGPGNISVFDKSSTGSNTYLNPTGTYYLDINTDDFSTRTELTLDRSETVSAGDTYGFSVGTDSGYSNDDFFHLGKNAEPETADGIEVSTFGGGKNISTFDSNGNQLDSVELGTSSAPDGKYRFTFYPDRGKVLVRLFDVSTGKYQEQALLDYSGFTSFQYISLANAAISENVEFDQVIYDSEASGGSTIEVLQGDGSGLDADKLNGNEPSQFDVDKVDGQDHMEYRIDNQVSNHNYDSGAINDEILQLDDADGTQNVTLGQRPDGDNILIKDTAGVAAQYTRTIESNGNANFPEGPIELTQNYSAVKLYYYETDNTWYVESRYP